MPRDPEVVQEDVRVAVRVARYMGTLAQMLAERGMYMSGSVYRMPRDVFDALPGDEVVSITTTNGRESAFWWRTFEGVDFFTTEPPIGMRRASSAGRGDVDVLLATQKTVTTECPDCSDGSIELALLIRRARRMRSRATSGLATRARRAAGRVG